MSIPNHRGPRPLSDILGELFARESFGQLRTRHELEEAWITAVGEPYSHQTRLGDIRRGILNVTVAHSAILEELSAFHKPALLSALKSCASGTVIRDIRFHVGDIAIVKNTRDLSSEPIKSQRAPEMRAKGKPPQSGRDNNQP